MQTSSQELVDEQAYSWTEMHKKSAVSFLILNALKTKDMWSKDLEQWIRNIAGWDLSERSLYRILRRMEKQGTIQYKAEAAARTGAERKVYTITADGMSLLDAMKSELRYLVKLA